MFAIVIILHHKGISLISSTSNTLLLCFPSFISIRNSSFPLECIIFELLPTLWRSVLARTMALPFAYTHHSCCIYSVCFTFAKKVILLCILCKSVDIYFILCISNSLDPTICAHLLLRKFPFLPLPSPPLLTVAYQSK